jgi:hypothetical protein
LQLIIEDSAEIEKMIRKFMKVPALLTTHSKLKLCHADDNNDMAVTKSASSHVLMWPGADAADLIIAITQFEIKVDQNIE